MEIDLYTALRVLHQRTEAGITSSIQCYKLNGEYRVYEQVFIRKGYRNNQSKRAKYLVSFEDVTTGQVRQFHRRLIMKINNHNITV